jgi:integrase
MKGRENEEAAWKEFHRLLAQDPATIPEQTSLKVAHVCDLFLRHSEKHNEKRAFTWYQKFLQSFCESCGTIGALDVKPFHVTRWLDVHPKWTTSQRCAVISIKRAYNWAEGEGILSTNPLQRVKKPAATRRDRILTSEERQQIFAAIKDQEFRDVVFALRETGARPGEVRQLTVRPRRANSLLVFRWVPNLPAAVRNPATVCATSPASRGRFCG